MKKETSKNLNGNVEKYIPKVNIYSAYGDMRDIISMTSKALKQNNMYEQSREMIERATLSYSYDDAFNIISEYVEMTKEKEHEEEEEFE